MLTRYGHCVCIQINGEWQKSSRGYTSPTRPNPRPKLPKLRLGRHRIPHLKALQRVKTHLKVNYCQQGLRSVTAEAVSVELNLHIGCVKKAFMALNRSGLLSQAFHRNERQWGEEDWSADTYVLFY